jgi:putative nucleotidyltransferase with HDIG domain
MTGFADLADTLDAHTSGAAGFLAKPFNQAELLDILATCFPGDSQTEPAEQEPVDSEYCALNLEDFVSGSDIKYDIYVRLSAAKYVCIAHCGQDISVDRIKSYKAKGIRSLYMTKSDFRSYVKFNVALAGKVADAKSIDRVKKLNFLKHTSELIATSVFGDLPDADSVSDAKSLVETSMQLLADDDDAISVLGLLESNSDFVYAHSVAVSFYSVMIARKLQWKSTATYTKLSIGALFHDIGKKEIPRDTLAKPRKNLTVDEILMLESHAARGSEILRQIPNLSNDAVQIALEHHENCVGLGYPRRWKANKIHPLARVVAVANAFCELSLKSPSNPDPITPLEAINKMIQLNPEYYDPQVVVALMELFKFPVPDGFVESVKRRQRG